MREILAAGFILLVAGMASADVPEFRLGLDEGVSSALAKSDRLKAVERE